MHVTLNVTLFSYCHIHVENFNIHEGAFITWITVQELLALVLVLKYLQYIGLST
jgi:hypothetical protein